MEKHRKKSFIAKPKPVEGAGIVSDLVNKAIDKLPFELHLGGRSFCGPGTKLAQRLARGDKGIDPLDEACKLHDIEYSKFSDSKNRARADKDLAERAWKRFKAKDSSLGEKTAAWLVTTAMKAKTAIGGGNKKIKKKPPRKVGSGKIKKGGVLPLLPIFAGLSALGALTSGAASVAKVITDNKNAKKTLAELERHNRATEGKGLYLRPYPKQVGAGSKKRKKTSKKKRQFP
jgi:hypothetical protein